MSMPTAAAARAAHPTLDITAVRAHFPALATTDDGRPRIYLDNPAGTQVPRQVIDRTTEYFTRWNANLGSEHAASRRSDQIVAAAHQAMADFLGAASPREVVLGANMTSLTFALSRSLAHLLAPGDEILLTRLEHDANVRPWEILAEERGLVVKRIDFDPATGELDLTSLDRLVTERTRFAATSYASNVLGTINDVAAIARAVRAAGGLTFVDAVHYAPHGPIDVDALGCDFLVCSPYKFFGPHLGALWAREELLERLPPYKVRAAADELPGRFETGTQPHELYAGLLGAFDYLEWLGRELGREGEVASGVARSPAAGRPATGARPGILAAMNAIRGYEKELAVALLDGLRSVPGVRIHGIVAPFALDRRVPTVSISVEGKSPFDITRRLGERGIFATNGTGYALSVIERLGLADRGGVVRLGCVHYNTRDEIAAAVGRLRESIG
jgi:cysteine desulfurase family protein (TIGR01976 family)